MTVALKQSHKTTAASRTFKEISEKVQKSHRERKVFFQSSLKLFGLALFFNFGIGADELDFGEAVE